MKKKLNERAKPLSGAIDKLPQRLIDQRLIKCIY